MYQGKRKLLNPQKHEETRNEVISYRGGAIYNAFSELEGIINKTEFASQYIGKSQSYFSQRLNGCAVGGKSQGFSASEARLIADSFRDIAGRLTALAGEIEEVADLD